jgi:predicted Zn-dependent protease
MRTRVFIRLSLFLTLLLLLSCAVSPLGRRQLKLVPDGEMNQLGLAAFDEMKSSGQLAQNPRALKYVRCVAEAILGATEDPTGVAGWEVQLFDDESPNAFALPGGRIGVHTGLLDVARTPDQLAAVIGHEVGHVIARHGNERISTSYVMSAGLSVVDIWMGDKDPKDRDQILQLLGVGATLGVMLPFSRTHESEADIIGLDLMARAGFDPRASVELWENMMAAGGVSPPEFLSTHPSGDTRIRDLQTVMPGAMMIYDEARAAGKKPRCKP